MEGYASHESESEEVLGEVSVEDCDDAADQARADEAEQAESREEL